MDLVDPLWKISHKPERLVVGLMSGMSRDGLGLVRLRGERPTVELLASRTVD